MTRRSPAPWALPAAISRAVRTAARASPFAPSTSSVPRVRRAISDPPLPGHVLSPLAPLRRSRRRSSSPSATRRTTRTRLSSGRDHFEGRVLGCCADERDRPVFDVRQDDVLLGLVETMDLVDEEHRALAGTARRAWASATIACEVRPRPRRRPRWRRTRPWSCRASKRASVVLPQPGGPQRMTEGRCPRSGRRRAASIPGPTASVWPTNSSRVRGRMRAASGASAATACFGDSKDAGSLWRRRLTSHVSLPAAAIVTPSPPSFGAADSNRARADGGRERISRIAARKAPVPLPWMIRTNGKPARKASSR